MSINREDIKEKIAEAVEITENLSEPFKSIAFEVILKQLVEGPISPSSPRPSSIPIVAANMQASEFLASLHLTSQLDQLEAIAYHFLHLGQDFVARAEITDTLAKARLARPKNISDVIGKCIRRGHIIETDREGKKVLQITPTGEKYIEEKLKPAVKS